MANGLLLREFPTGEPVDSSAHHIHPAMVVVCEFNPPGVAPLTYVISSCHSCPYSLFTLLGPVGGTFASVENTPPPTPLSCN